MDQPDREAAPQFSQPVRQILLMLLVLGLAGFVLVLALPRILPVFESNPYLNGFILFVFVLGVMGCVWQVVSLIKAVRWIEGFARGMDSADAPQMLAPLASLLKTRGARMQIATSSQRSILDSVAQRIDEGREITRYITSLLIFLGLLGTFYGLATTVPALVETIRGLAPQEGEDGVAVFGRLMAGLDQQLSGMGTAFGSSLLGLAGSLVVGLLELFAGHGQNRFYRELEEWLSSFTRVGYASGSEGDTGFNAQVAELLGGQVEALQTMFTQSDVSRAIVDQKLSTLTDAVLRLTERMEGQTAAGEALAQVAASQDRLADILEKTERGEGMDAESRMRLRSIDVQLLRILEEISAGRQESMTELRTDLAALTRVISMAGGRAPAPRPPRPPSDRES